MRVIVYYPTWSIYEENKRTFEDIPIDSVTHVTIAFALPNKDGTIDCQEIDKMIKLGKLKESGVRLGIAIGGWGTSEEFKSALGENSRRNRFVDECLRMIQRYYLDYLEIDWEFPEDEEQNNQLIETLKCLRKLVHKSMELSVCLPCFNSRFKASNLTEFVDFFVLMGYDFCGNWSRLSGHHAALHPTITERVNYLIEKEMIAKEKIVLACPLYGRIFNSCKGLNSPFVAGDNSTATREYRNILQECKKVEFDFEQVGQYGIIGDDFVSFDGPLSIESKCNWVKQNGLGGMAFWNAIGDAPNEESLIRQACEWLK